jgi:hypothetical protein
MSIVSNRRTARGNRVGLAVVGALLLVTAIAALARGLDLLPDLLGDPDEPVLADRVRNVAAEGWFWPAVAAGCLVVALLALRWLLAQVRSDATRTLRLETDPSRGQTSLPARVVAAAVTDDLASLPLRHTRAAITGRPDRPRLELALTLAPDPDLYAVRQGLHRTLSRHRQALETPDLPATVLFR